MNVCDYQQAPAERVKAKMKLQLSETGKSVEDLIGEACCFVLV